MKGFSASASAIAIGSVTATGAETENHEEILNNEKVSVVLSEAGDPQLLDSKSEVVRRENGDSVAVITRIQTEVGTLTHVETNQEIRGQTTTAYFTFNERKGKNQRKIPHRFRSVPKQSKLLLVHENGTVVAKREATVSEKKALAAITNVNRDEMQALYNENENRFLVLDADDGNGDALVEIQDSSYEIDQQLTSVIRRDDINVIKADEIITIQEDHCWDVGILIRGTGPCVECARNGAITVGCAGACAATGGPGCIPCLAGAPITGGACGCCLACVDEVPGDCTDFF